MTTHALMHPLIYYVEAARSQLGAMRPDDPDEGDFWDGLTAVETQLRTAAAEGGEAVYQYRWFDRHGLHAPGSWSECTKESFEDYRAHPDFPRDHEFRTLYLYLHPPTDSGAGRDGERFRYLMSPEADMVWAHGYDGKIRWSFYMDMPAPNIDDGYLGPGTVKAELIAAIDTAIAGAAGDSNTLSGDTK